MSFNWKASGLFAAGVAFGTAGIKILSSKIKVDNFGYRILNNNSILNIK